MLLVKFCAYFLQTFIVEKHKTIPDALVIKGSGPHSIPEVKKVRTGMLYCTSLHIKMFACLEGCNFLLVFAVSNVNHWLALVTFL